ncbi:23S rRNA (uracil(1939)-C(5))-methyltransferase RlmD [Mediterraneibacter gnavus]|uniref:23S rRNA (Uracil(1939)-C(5))-methyltransferase RlmD n=1 Tax=Mediterraneibacter gnavus TaxID=33038 RepID=A0AAW6K379_MEDGN|nr:23S rRNA (uracil(1939)-C(5))-methyltransferase RlmD [Mediterraneibacter gnavus]MDB8698575.1 23S rRNA (uracil(1939)-C(5))-methyltransferase RlmD [Mediterraneibacter gnavus]MDC6141122.1 23S rRNA (uracil(1939)-C(5))-methyltransferase RlmD [Mediterraneibacter gnavus]MDE1204688.1 23S rRNA (uracil(1939)-C(5))-methyltransferase RlmD [Mediterraneibacter gnavus]RHE68972.1 23S rRNA (uracil(1939)-C(5))-methyltransferase RlmD [Mediterraneibacter gnavus]RHM34337.1 23S rRNA (uracil(1939)-C(5))-methyltran
MKKGQVLEGTIEKVEFPNKGVVTVAEEGKSVIVKNGIPGQKVKFCVNKFKRGNAEGRLLEVLEKSPLETRKPVCSIFPACGGCMYQTMSYEAQMEMKAEQVKNILNEAVNGEYLFEGVKASPKEFAYRNKMEFSFGDEYKDGPLTLGLHKKGSTYDVLTASDCKLVHDDMTKILNCVLEYFKQRNVSYYKKMQHTGYLRHLLLRRGDRTGEILVNLVTTTQEEHDMSPLKEALLNLELEGKIVGFLHILNDSLSDVVQSDETRIIYGQDYFYEKLLNLEFKITPFSFFQPNSRGAEVLYSTVRDYIGDINDMTVFDLFSGTGTIAQVLAPVAKQVIGVEIIEEAVEAAKENAAHNGLSNCKFIAGDVFKVLDEIEEKPDVIVLDPPRDGIHPKALPKILDYGVDKIVYISCKVTSLARDLEMIQARGYEVVKSVAVDQFCQTVHVETVVLLSHKKPDGHINVKVEFGEGEGKVPLDNIAKRAESYKPKERVTYKMIKEYIEAKYGFKVHTAYIAEVKRDLGLPMYDAPNAVEELKQPRKHPTAEKVEAIKDALKHFEVI